MLHCAIQRGVQLILVMISLMTLSLVELPVASSAEPETVVPKARDAKHMARHEAIVKRAKQGDVDLIFLGDSITQAWGDDGAEVWKKLYEPRKAMNAGISGDRTQHVLWRLENGTVDGLNPKLVVLMIGTNNSGRNEVPDTILGIQKIVESLKTRLPKSKILVLGIFPRGATPDDAKRQANAAVNQQIAKLADNKTVFFLDIGDKFLAADGTLSKKIMPDLLHLSPQGYEIWGEAIEPTVTKLMGK